MSDLDATRGLRDAENALRDFIAETLERALGPDWATQSGVTPERIQRWTERKEEEGKRQKTGVVEERTLYYADFFDLPVILKKHWDPHFAPVFGEWRTLEVWLSELQRLRDPEAHRRELLPHQHHLALGIAGEIRTRIAKFRSSRETADSYFPRIESVRDNLGNIWVPSAIFKIVDTGKTLRPGDTLDFLVTAIDPLEDVLEYSIGIEHEGQYGTQNTGSVTIRPEHIGKHREVKIRIRSRRNHHAYPGWDDHINFVYDVVPGKP